MGILIVSLSWGWCLFTSSNGFVIRSCEFVCSLVEDGGWIDFYFSDGLFSWRWLIYVCRFSIPRNIW